MITANPNTPICEGQSENETGTFNYQGTKLHFLTLNGVDTTKPELDYIFDAVVLHGPFTCLEGQMMNFYTQVVTGVFPVYSVVKRNYRLLPALTSVGGLIGEDVEPNFSPGSFMADGDEIYSQGESAELFNDLGELSDLGDPPIITSIEDKVNEGNAGEAWVIDGLFFFTGTIEGIQKLGFSGW